MQNIKTAIWISFSLVLPCQSLTLPELQSCLVDAQKLFTTEELPKNIQLESFKGKKYFFKSYVKPLTLLKLPKLRSYVVHYNQDLLKMNSPDHEAIRAILVHELAHIRDYSHMGFWQFVYFVIKYALFDHSAYERKTDEVALQKGLGSGLKKYREWLYQNIAPKTLKNKQKNYYTPQEIDHWLQTNK